MNERPRQPVSDVTPGWLIKTAEDQKPEPLAKSCQRPVRVPPGHRSPGMEESIVPILKCNIRAKKKQRQGFTL